jgi:hypothetical protein
MERSLCSLDLNTLKSMYEREAMKLRTALINGARWDELVELRYSVTELAIAMHQKRFPSDSNPAEKPGRNNE